MSALLFLLLQWRREVFKRQIGVFQAEETSLDIEAQVCVRGTRRGVGEQIARENSGEVVRE